MERYLLASGKISRLAVGDPKIDPIVDTYRVRADLTQNEHIEGLPLGTRGGVLIHHDFPLDGEYVIKVKLLKSTVDLLFGNNAQDQLLEIALNGERVQTLSINPKVAAPPPAPAAGSEKPKEGFDPAAATKLSMSQPKDNRGSARSRERRPANGYRRVRAAQLRPGAGSDGADRSQHLRPERSQGPAACAERSPLADRSTRRVPATRPAAARFSCAIRPARATSFPARRKSFPRWRATLIAGR